MQFEISLTHEEHAKHHISISKITQEAEKTRFWIHSQENKLAINIDFKEEVNDHKQLESLRKLGHRIYSKIGELEISDFSLKTDGMTRDETKAILEGIVLSSYSFQKFKSHKSNRFMLIDLISTAIKEPEIKELSNVLNAVFTCKDLVNTPANHQSALNLAHAIRTIGEESGFEVEVLEKNKIESLKMAGLLAVNAGSYNPPTFVIVEYKPESKVNTEPLVLVGKGVVYDTGGLSIKPTPNSMDIMKCDMAGAATVVSTIQAIASNTLPYHVIGLIPITDNCVSATSIRPGDIIEYSNKKTVEILNTDAEGRLILADALLYAKQFKPRLVVDIATLTGAALRAIGPSAAAVMGNATDNVINEIIESGFETHERLVELPLWDDYNDSLKSDTADINNIGGNNAGAITAGKFLEHFVDYDWLHLDIAGPSFTTAPMNYWGKQATGFGVRLMYQFINKTLNEPI